MFANLTMAVRDRIIQELRDFWQDDPRYVGFSNNIQGKYSFEERPQFGMVVRTGGASNVVLSPNNFIGTVQGRVYLAGVAGKKTYGSIEWVREDVNAVFEEGIYHVKVYDAPDQDVVGHLFDVVLRRYLRVTERDLVMGAPDQILLNDLPVQNSLRIIEHPSDRILRQDEYSVDYGTGVITLSEAVLSGLSLRCIYTVDKGDSETFRVRPDVAYRDIVSGAVLAFGRKLKGGDEQIVVVSGERESVAQEYGGRWDVSVDLDLIARDVHSQADIADRTVVWIWASLRDKLTNLGVDVMDVSLGGEAEEVYDENGDDYFYTASISFTVQTNWFIHFPLMVPILAVSQEEVLPFAIEPPSAPVVGAGSSWLGQRLL